MKKFSELNYNNFLSQDDFDQDAEFIPIISEEEEQEVTDMNVPDVLPILPLRNTVLFPGVVIPITVGRSKSLKLVQDVYQKNKILGTIAQRDPEVEEPKKDDLFEVGTVAQILKILEMPDGSTSIIIQGKKRFRLVDVVSDKPYLVSKVEVQEDLKEGNQDELKAIIASLKELSLKIIKLSSNIPPEATFAVKNIESTTFLINFLSSNNDMDLKDKQALLEINDLRQRGIRLLEYLTREVQMLELKNDIQTKVKHDLDQQQREYLLQQQMKTIQDELGGNPIEQEIKDLKQKAGKKKWGEEIKDYFLKEVDKLHRLNPASGEYSVQLNYIQTLLDLPWNIYTKDNFNLQRAEKILNRDHFGLEKVKERILEHLAVLKLKGDLKSPILCLVGPPGVGKTSLGKSVASALGRKYVRISLGGLHDEAEIRGHRKTYIGAMPGRIIQNLKKTKSSNPVFVLDEIDKVGHDFHGDPASSLLEVLDPEQNSAFHDNYLEVDFDLSRVMFIATANTTSTINPALLDRMEIIEVSGYLVEEKIEIAKRHLIPKQLNAHGLKKSDIRFDKKAIEHVIEYYTRESGVRQLDKQMAKIMRVTARKLAFGEEFKQTIKVNDITEILGPLQFLKDRYENNDFAGVVTGLAWTAVGGEILFVETSLSKGKGNLTLTGNLGEVMKESAIIALEYLKAHSDIIGINDPEVFENWNVHVHIPEGAIPKDGPSAGITMLTSIASAFTQKKVRKNLAMTGEITLRGKVLPVGGIKEKILAAKRAGITDIIMSRENEKDITEIKDIYRKGLTFHYVDTIMEVLEHALLKEKVKKPMKIS
ncbi:MAG TPA: endopeptidase La [Bacteroidales bacterium]|nr:endopeptidase La [Bacteroidales bacterium]